MQKAKTKSKNKAPIGTIITAIAVIVLIVVSMFIPKEKEQSLTPEQFKELNQKVC